MTDGQVYAGAAVIGAVAGLRSMTAPAAVSRWADPGAVGSGIVRTATAFAIAEAVADKLPFMPKRTDSPSLVWRAISGGVSGALLCSSKKRSPFFGAVLGGLAAVGATYAAYELRRRAVQSLHVPDAVVAVAEDALAATSGWFVMSKLHSAIEA
jgi:uncharacterized membrane protein